VRDGTCAMLEPPALNSSVINSEVTTANFLLITSPF